MVFVGSNELMCELRNSIEMFAPGNVFISNDERRTMNENDAFALHHNFNDTPFYFIFGSSIDFIKLLPSNSFLQIPHYLN